MSHFDLRFTILDLNRLCKKFDDYYSQGTQQRGGKDASRGIPKFPVQKKVKNNQIREYTQTQYFGQRLYHDGIFQKFSERRSRIADIIYQKENCQRQNNAQY